MEFGVWFADDMKRILQSIATTGDDFAAMARNETDPKVLQAYQAGFHAALRSVAQALNIRPPHMESADGLQLVKPRTRRRQGAARQPAA
ncbi:MAG TPA: hypothetical protein PLJ35_12035 [Anaerolineae bacterium]|nr:hypothetical protein [Anaerolineae bacterium]HOQ99541.1 hypothetical protein [Anaerolineae bacterium]HPL27857.1 hypothetical protein [Anaerolineae bacterium]